MNAKTRVVFVVRSGPRRGRADLEAAFPTRQEAVRFATDLHGLEPLEVKTLTKAGELELDPRVHGSPLCLVKEQRMPYDRAELALSGELYLVAAPAIVPADRRPLRPLTIEELLPKLPKVSKAKRARKAGAEVKPKVRKAVAPTPLVARAEMEESPAAPKRSRTAKKIETLLGAPKTKMPPKKENPAIVERVLEPVAPKTKLRKTRAEKDESSVAPKVGQEAMMVEAALGTSKSKVSRKRDSSVSVENVVEPVSSKTKPQKAVAPVPPVEETKPKVSITVEAPVVRAPKKRAVPAAKQPATVALKVEEPVVPKVKSRKTAVAEPIVPEAPKVEAKVEKKPKETVASELKPTSPRKKATVPAPVEVKLEPAVVVPKRSSASKPVESKARPAPVAKVTSGRRRVTVGV